MLPSPSSTKPSNDTVIPAITVVIDLPSRRPGRTVRKRDRQAAPFSSVYCLVVFSMLITRMTRSALSGGGCCPALPYR